MSKLSQLRLKLAIQPGIQVTETISAERKGGNADAVIRAMAKGCGGRNRMELVQCPSASDGEYVRNGSLYAYGSVFPIRLVIGSAEGLVLKDVSGTCRSMKPEKGTFVIGIGDQLTANQIAHVAEEILACWIIHGKDWTDRSGDIVPYPYGRERNAMPLGKQIFKVVDGKDDPLTVRELIARGCTRSTHVGDWIKRHSTLIAALCGMKTILHEMKSEGTDVCMCGGVVIGDTPKIWGPYCPWNEAGRESLFTGKWGSVAEKAATPFAFHVHTTRSIVADVELESSYLLRILGCERLVGMLAATVEKDPERFYRLIDADGRTYRLAAVEKHYLVYGNGIFFSREDIVHNVMETFRELRNVEDDAAYVMPRKQRIVPDTHFYIVAEALAANTERFFSLSGRDAHRYLTEGGSASMHRIRNERLFRLLKEYGTIDSVEFHIHPPIEADSGLMSQYGDLTGFDSAQWLGYKA